MIGRTIGPDKMRRVVTIGLFAGSAVIALALSGCVTEEIGPTDFHTTAYIERDASSVNEDQSRANATPLSTTDNSNSSSGDPHH